MFRTTTRSQVYYNQFQLIEECCLSLVKDVFLLNVWHVIKPWAHDGAFSDDMSVSPPVCLSVCRHCEVCMKTTRQCSVGTMKVDYRTQFS